MSSKAPQIYPIFRVIFSLQTVGTTKVAVCKVMTHPPTPPPLFTKPQTLNHDKTLINPGI